MNFSGPAQTSDAAAFSTTTDNVFVVLVMVEHQKRTPRSEGAETGLSRIKLTKLVKLTQILF
jgi:hypothetical protein